MRINRHIASFASVLVIGLSLGHVACATDATPTKGDLEALQAQTIVLKAKLSKAKVESDLMAANKTSKGGTDESAVSFDAPVVSEVYGSPGQLKATFLYADGTSVPGRVGDHIAGDCTVLRVALDSVRIRCHGRTTDVGFSGTAPVASKPAVSSGQTTQGSFPMPSFQMPTTPVPGVSDAH